jgi:mono/diheme cytochrome c family protein
MRPSFIILVAGLGVAAAIALLLIWRPPGDDSKTDEATRVAEGAALASLYCARCHAIRGKGPSPEPDAPPFSSFIRKWPAENLAEAMAEGMMVGHQNNPMPVFAFTPEEIDALIAYLESLEKE